MFNFINKKKLSIILNIFICCFLADFQFVDSQKSISKYSTQQGGGENKPLKK